MIESNYNNSRYADWNTVPVTNDAEALAPQAALKFYAETTLSEKIQRVFNAAMFCIVGAKLLSVITPVASLGGMAFAALGGASLAQIPVAVAILALAPKIIFALALLIVIRKVLAVIINHAVYIAVPPSYFNKLDSKRVDLFNDLTRANFECRRVALNKSGIDYDSFVFEHEDTKGNGQWVIMAGGNGWRGEGVSQERFEKFKNLGFNILFVNGPGVSRSSGFPTSYSIGAGQEAGLQFLEKTVKAKKMLLFGTSLGGGAQSEAILSHEFKDDIDYLVWSDRTFDYLSNAASRMVTALAKPIFFLLGIELDGIAGARKLQTLGITHIVTQNSRAIVTQNAKADNGVLPLTGKIENFDKAGSDGVIPNDASLYVGLRLAGMQDSERLKCFGCPWVDHNGDLPHSIESLVGQEITAFLAKTRSRARNNP